MWEYPTFLRVRRYRVACPQCGLTLEPLPFAADGPMVTRSLAALVAELYKVMTVRVVATLMLLHRATVKTLDKEALRWKGFGQDRAQLITHTVMDMWRPFRNSFKAHCPGVEIICDKFHVIRHLLEALNDVRKAELCKAAGRFKGLLTGKKFVLLARQAHVRGQAREALHELLGASRKLLKAHVLKESFNHLWSYKSKTCARRFFDDWVDQLKWSRLKPYHKFARMVESHFDGILAYCDKKARSGTSSQRTSKPRMLSAGPTATGTRST